MRKIKKYLQEFGKSFKKMDVFKWILFIILFAYVLSMLFVLYFGLINSIKSTEDFMRGNVLGLPRKGIWYGWKFTNYTEMFTKFSVQSKPAGQTPRDVFALEMFFYSLIFSVLMSVFSIATQVMVAYAVAKYDFKGKKLLYNIAIIVMIIPIVGSLPSELQFAQFFHLNDSFLGVCLIRCKYPGLYFLVFYAAFKSIPWTYAEAAQMDGAGHWMIFWKFMLPLIGSTLSAVFVLQFIANFNDYYTPMIFVPNKPTIAYGLYMYKITPEQPRVLAATIFSCLPVLVLFIIFRNKIMGNVSVGGIKG